MSTLPALFIDLSRKYSNTISVSFRVNDDNDKNYHAITTIIYLKFLLKHIWLYRLLNASIVSDVTVEPKMKTFRNNYFVKNIMRFSTPELTTPKK